MNGSTIGGTSKEFLNKQKIRILKSDIHVPIQITRKI